METKGKRLLRQKWGVSHCFELKKSRFLGKDVLSELTNNITARRVLTDQEGTHAAVSLGAANLGSALPNHLGEVAGASTELTSSIVVLAVLVVPGLKGTGGGVTHGDVLTVRTTRVLELAVVTSKVVAGEASKLIVPLDGTNTVLGTNLVMVVDNGLGEGVEVGVGGVGSA